MSEQPQEKTGDESEEGKKERKPRPPLVLADMTAAIVKPAVVKERKRKVNRTGGKRSDNQLAIDKLVTGVHAAWVKAGKPEKWEERPGGQVLVPAEQVESFYSLLYAAGPFLNVRVRRGEVREVEKDGRAFIDVVFTVTDIPAEPEEDEKSEDKPEDKPEGSQG